MIRRWCKHCQNFTASVFAAGVEYCGGCGGDGGRRRLRRAQLELARRSQ